MKKIFFIFGFLFLFNANNLFAKEVVIGIDADMSSGSKVAGQAIYRGVKLAVDDINSKGGLLGNKVKIIIKDHKGNPARGKDNLKQFSKLENLVAVVGGLHTPVVLAELPLIHKKNMLFLVPWAAGTSIIENGYNPNNVFRVSVRDEYVGKFLIKELIKHGYKKPALLLENTGWGRSNEKSIKKAISSYKNIDISSIQWIFWGSDNLDINIKNIIKSDADSIVFVGNSPEGVSLVKSLYKFKSDLPVFSHWGITGGDFFEKTKDKLGFINLKFLQTYSFFLPLRKKQSDIFKNKYFKSFGVKSILDIKAPSGSVHAYDIMRLFFMAVEKAESFEIKKVRAQLENINYYNGIMKEYVKPFSKNDHDALDSSNFHLMEYNNQGGIVKVGRKK